MIEGESGELDLLDSGMGCEKVLQRCTLGMPAVAGDASDMAPARTRLRSGSCAAMLASLPRQSMRLPLYQ
jgi:hypothetical protein